MWSPVVQLRSLIIGVGGRALHVARAEPRASRPHVPLPGRPRAASRGAVMSHASEHVDLVAWWLLPIRCRRRVSALLHEGRPPATILELAIADCLPQARPAAD